MKTIRRQYYGIKFPFTANNQEKHFVDLNRNIGDKAISEILHVIMTPKRSRIRMPEFGTDLPKYIFGQNDDITWERINDEVVTAVKRYVRDTEINSIRVVIDENNDKKIYLALSYSISRGNTVETNKAFVEII